jgi:sugar/nucleoside kinase (ribokinase family)
MVMRTDGTALRFGSASGILVVDRKGKQELIAHPEGLEQFGLEQY